MVRRRTSRLRRSGFTLLEVMLAMGIFVVGFIAIAAIFITAVHLQKRTLDEITTQEIGDNVEAVLLANPLTTAEINGFYYQTTGTNTQNTHVKRILDSAYTPPTHLKWSVGDRSYPVLDANDATNILRRNYYWVPLIRDANGEPNAPAWQIYVMILRRPHRGSANFTKPLAPLVADDYANPDDDDKVPTVRRLAITSSDAKNFFFGNDPRILNEGDWLLDNNGNIYRVVEAKDGGVVIDGVISQFPTDPFELWIGVPPDNQGANPLKRIEVYAGGGLVGP